MRLETLKRRSEFDRLRRGRKWVAKGFILQAAPRKNDLAGDSPRFGFVMSSRALKNKRAGSAAKRPGAVLRNRARRRLKEAVRLLSASYARPGYDYVIIGRGEALHQRFADLLEDLQQAFNKVNHAPHTNGDVVAAQRRTATARENQRQTEGL